MSDKGTVRGKGTRNSREQETREAQGVHDEDPILFEEEGPLPVIPARPGFVQRWIRIKTKQGDDAQNIARAARRGWKPRDPATVHKSMKYLTVQNEGLGGVIGTHDSILMERPEGIQERVNKIEKGKRRDLESAVKHNLFREHSQLNGAAAGITPQFETKATVERGRPAHVADD